MDKVLKSLGVWAIAFMIIAAGGAGIYLQLKSQAIKKDTQLTLGAAEQAAPKKDLTADLTIKYSDSQIATYSGILVQEGATVLDLTQKVASVSASGEGVNSFILGIDGRVADSNKREFWELNVNGNPASVGAGSLNITDGDKIEWRISQY